jgi:phthiocerol/phenolphthiocerol synthesis type-I polyketide synthase E
MPLEADIFEFGGDSLLIVRLLSIVRESFTVEVPLADVLVEPTPAALAVLIQKRLDAGEDGEQVVADDNEIEELADELAGLESEDIDRLLSEAARQAR